MNVLLNEILKLPSLTTLPLRVEEGLLPALITQTGPSMRAAVAAAVAVSTGRPLVVICPDMAEGQAFLGDLRCLMEKEPLFFTERDFILRDTEAVSRQDEQKRLQILNALCAGTVDVMVCTLPAVLQKTLPRELLQAEVFELRVGEGNGPEEVESLLLESGYTRSEMVEGPGQFSRRGGILDIYSPGERQPVRAEFWGDEVDSMGFFDTETQRRTENTEVFRVLPARETVLGVSDIPELAASLEKRASRLNWRQGVYEEHIRVLRRDAEQLRQGLSLPWIDRYLPMVYPRPGILTDYLPEDALVWIDSPARCTEKAAELLQQEKDNDRILLEGGIPVGTASDYYAEWDTVCGTLSDFALLMGDSFTAGRYNPEPKGIFRPDSRQLPSYGGSVETAVSDIQHYMDMGYRILIYASDERRADILYGLIQNAGLEPIRGVSGGIPPEGRCAVTVGGLSTGLDIPEMKLAILTDTQLLAPGIRLKKKKKAAANRERLSSCADLSVGDPVVHEKYGIGRFSGIVRMTVDGVVKDYMKISYAGSDVLYVPATQLDMVSKYIGGGEDAPVRLSKMGGAEWHRSKSRAKAAAKELAEELTKLYAERQRTPGFAFSPDTTWQTEFEDAFGYIETDDQLRCIREIKQDMEEPVPMDRLLCGDVGYGKTEVALRAAMKCIMDGKQCAILVPTTVLARQHFQTATRRFFGYPVNIALLSRYSTSAQKKDTLQKLRAGSIDLLIGTHSLLQKGVVFKDLGLLIVDEEQRFGVSHKEKLKEMAKGVDVLTLSATPIPRTLNMALSGLRSMSTLEEPPQDRQPVQTFVIPHDTKTICDAIKREILRGGQVYYLHNRIDNIETTALKLQSMLEGVTVAVAHGQMDESQISRVMDDMVEGKIQVLVCTTIIETGIDIPNVNTLIIENADMFGLAQLHQLRGRVGRSSRRASAYLTYKKEKALSEVAEKRLSAIREFAEFNAGFQIAMRDLEIRGAGNLLGAEQSGHMMDVGYDLYLKLLEEAVLEEKGETPAVRTECSADLTVTANIPETYVSSTEQRMDLYRRIALIRTEEDADDLTDELVDRFGDPPPPVNTLVHVALLRGEAGRAGITDITQKSGTLRFSVSDFSAERVTAVYSDSAIQGRIKVEAGKDPCLSYRLRPGEKPIAAARAFVAAWQKTAPSA